MFGYLIPYKDELKVKELSLWQAAYCGVCHAIGEKNGQLPRLALQNDMASLAVMLIDLSGESFSARKRVCPTHVINRKPAVNINTSLIYCADVTTLMTHHKLSDMWHDEKKLYAPPAKLAIKHGFRKAKKRNPELAKTLSDTMDKFYEVEAQKDVYYDVPAALSGDMMHAVAMGAPNIGDNEKKALSELMRNLGIWIYLADAMEDLDDDIKKGTFNPFLRDGAPSAELINSAKEVMTFALSRSMLAFELLPLDKSKGIMDNIIRFSLPTKQNAIFRQSESDFPQTENTADQGE